MTMPHVTEAGYKNPFDSINTSLNISASLLILYVIYNFLHLLSVFYQWFKDFSDESLLFFADTVVQFWCPVVVAAVAAYCFRTDIPFNHYIGEKGGEVSFVDIMVYAGFWVEDETSSIGFV